MRRACKQILNQRPLTSSTRFYHNGIAPTYNMNPVTGGHSSGIPEFRATTILVVRRDGESVIIGDGQVSMGNMVSKTNAQKVRAISNGNVMVGIAGSAADCMTMIDRFELLLEEHPGQMLRAGVELAKNWRTDKYLRQLNAMMLCVDKDMSLTLDGTGNVMKNESVAAIGSGGAFALAAATALIDVPGLTAEEIARKSMTIAGDMCVFTNHNFVVKKLVDPEWAEKQKAEQEQAQGEEAPDNNEPLGL